MKSNRRLSLTTNNINRTLIESALQLTVLLSTKVNGISTETRLANVRVSLHVTPVDVIVWKS